MQDDGIDLPRSPIDSLLYWHHAPKAPIGIFTSIFAHKAHKGNVIARNPHPFTKIIVTAFIDGFVLYPIEGKIRHGYQKFYSGFLNSPEFLWSNGFPDER